MAVLRASCLELFRTSHVVVAVEVRLSKKRSKLHEKCEPRAKTVVVWVAFPESHYRNHRPQWRRRYSLAHRLSWASAHSVDFGHCQQSYSESEMQDL